MNNSLILASISPPAKWNHPNCFVKRIWQCQLWHFVNSKVFLITTMISSVKITTIAFILILSSRCSLTLSLAPRWSPGSLPPSSASQLSPLWPSPLPSLAPPSPCSAFSPSSFSSLSSPSSSSAFSPSSVLASSPSFFFIYNHLPLTNGALACRLTASSLLKAYWKSDSQTARLVELYLC